MRRQDDIWQSCCDYWQDRFIREHFLPLGYAAWQGFMTQGQGMVVCDVANIDINHVDWSRDVVTYTAHFLPEIDIPAYLYGLNLEATVIDSVIDTVQTYDPTQNILLTLRGNGALEIHLLQHLAISPSDCYQQLQRRRSEFQLDSSTLWRNL